MVLKKDKDNSKTQDSEKEKSTENQPQDLDHAQGESLGDNQNPTDPENNTFVEQDEPTPVIESEGDYAPVGARGNFQYSELGSDQQTEKVLPDYEEAATNPAVASSFDQAVVNPARDRVKTIDPSTGHLTTHGELRQKPVGPHEGDEE